MRAVPSGMLRDSRRAATHAASASTRSPSWTRMRRRGRPLPRPLLRHIRPLGGVGQKGGGARRGGGIIELAQKAEGEIENVPVIVNMAGLWVKTLDRAQVGDKRRTDKRTGTLRTAGSLHTIPFAAVIDFVVQSIGASTRCLQSFQQEVTAEGSATDPPAESASFSVRCCRNILGMALNHSSTLNALK